MQLLRLASTDGPPEEACAADLLDTVPMVMRVLRGYLRQHRSGLSVVQFRTLYYLELSEASSLSDAAEFIGLSAAAMSRLVDGLVERQFVKRRTCVDDRRHVRLALTAKGQATLREARARSRAMLAGSIRTLSAEQRETVAAAMRTLREAFGPAVAHDGGAETRSGGEHQRGVG